VAKFRRRSWAEKKHNARDCPDCESLIAAGTEEHGTFKRNRTKYEALAISRPSVRTNFGPKSDPEPVAEIDVQEVVRKATVVSAMDTREDLKKIEVPIHERLLTLSPGELVEYFQNTNLPPEARAEVLMRMADFAEYG